MVWMISARGTRTQSQMTRKLAGKRNVRALIPHLHVGSESQTAKKKAKDTSKTKAKPKVPPPPVIAPSISNYRLSLKIKNRIF
jgi:hypothetical protein